MCLSPHEMSTTDIEETVQWIKDHLDYWKEHDDYMYSVWGGRLEGFEKILKERAEAGTY